MNERFRERLRSLAAEASETPDVHELQRRGRRRAAGRRIATVVATFVLCFALALPIYALSGLGRDHQATDGSPSGSSAPTSADTQSPSEQAEPSPSASDRVPDVLTVTCAADGMELGSTQVQTQPDGVHVQVHLEDPDGPGWSAALLTRDVGRFDTFSLGSNVYTFPPGRIYASCDGIPKHPSAPGVQEFQVVDPNGYWVSDELACDKPMDARGVDPWAGFRNPTSTPEEAVRNFVPGVLPSDEVVSSEYGPRPDEGYAWVIVRRDGVGLARFQVVTERHQEAWYIHFGETCPGSGVGEA